LPIVRSRHSFDEQYTTIPNTWIRDPKLSLKAKGLLAQLMSHTPGWSVTIRSLAEANLCGRDLIAGAIAELEEHRYLKRRQERTDDGRFSETVWETCDPTVTDKPLPENPSPDNPAYKKTITKEDQVKEHPQAELEGLFEAFWKVYPKKVEKLDARKAFDKAFKEHGHVVIGGAIALSEDPNLPPKQFIPYPASWLRAGGWTNEPYPPRERTKEELEALARERAEKARERALEASRALSEEMRLARENASEAPRCEHGKNIATCLPCSKKLAETASVED
jgi:hypothetical protein